MCNLFCEKNEGLIENLDEYKLNRRIKGFLCIFGVEYM